VRFRYLRCTSTIGRIDGGLAFGTRAYGGASPFLKVVEHIQADCGRKVPRLSGLVDIRDEVREVAILRDGNILQSIPEFGFGTHARLMTRNDDRSFEYGRPHEPVLQ
jgi:hypothetical protein